MFKLVYGRKPRGLLEILDGRPAASGEPAPQEAGLYVAQLREHLETIRELTQENLARAQTAQKTRYDRGTCERSLQPRDQILVSQQAMAIPAGKQWQGPFRVTRVLGPVSYEVQCCPGRRGRKHLHIDDVQQWVARPGDKETRGEDRECLLQEPGELREGNLPWQELGVTETPEQPIMDEALSGDQLGDLQALLRQHTSLFSNQPGQTRLVENVINTTPGKVARVHWRPIPFKTKAAVEREVDEMLRLGVIEPSQSEWRSPIVLVPKPDGSIWFCMDYREVNKLAQFDAYLMPQADILIGQLGRAQYLSALDLTKGYWQVPIRPQDRKKTAFTTPSGLYQFRWMPFGLHGAAATFQRLVDQAWRDVNILPEPISTT